MNKIMHVRFGFILLSIFLFACNGGETGTGIGDRVVSIGTITGFGSVYLNGVKFDTTESSIRIDDEQNASESGLSVGMIVAVNGVKDSDSSGMAYQLSYESEIKGIVFNNDPLISMLDVMGQSVAYDADTQFELAGSVMGLAGPQDIQADAVVVISAYRKADNSLQATHIKVETLGPTPGLELTLKGRIHSLTDSSFKIGSLVIIYDSSTVLNDVPNGQLSEGLSVRIKSNRGFNAGQWLAGSIEVTATLNGEVGTEFEIEGMLGAHDEINRTLVLAGYEIRYNENTVFNFGDASQLLPNTKLEVEGRFLADGSFSAEEIEFRIKPDVIVSARVNAVDTANGRFTLLGQLIQVSNLTVMKDDSGQNVRKFSLQDLGVNDRLVVKAYADGAGQLFALELKRLEFLSSNENVQLKAKLQDITPAGEAVIAAVTVVDNDPDNSFNIGQVGNTVTIEAATYNVNTDKLTATKFSM